MGPGDLKQSICQLTPKDKRLLVGFENNEDACVYRLNDNEALVQTLDFITPVVDDPYIYGQIAAANSLSDVFAMGAEVRTAMNIVGFDAAHFGKEVLDEILRGGNDKLKECGGVLMGGHTIQTPEMYYGLSVTGMINPNKVLRNNTSKVGDVLVLTKPLGLGVLTTAIKHDKLSEAGIKEAVKVMATLNHKPSQQLHNYRVSACTDVTGFGLLGHALECANSEAALAIEASRVPILDEVYALAKEDVVPGGSKRNLEYLEDKVDYHNVSSLEKLVLCDAQTSGGLLVAMHKEDAQAYIEAVESVTYGYACVIGEVVERKKCGVEVY